MKTISKDTVAYKLVKYYQGEDMPDNMPDNMFEFNLYYFGSVLITLIGCITVLVSLPVLLFAVMSPFILIGDILYDVFISTVTGGVWLITDNTISLIILSSVVVFLELYTLNEFYLNINISKKIGKVLTPAKVKYV